MHRRVRLGVTRPACCAEGEGLDGGGSAGCSAAAGPVAVSLRHGVRWRSGARSGVGGGPRTWSFTRGFSLYIMHRCAPMPSPLPLQHFMEDCNQRLAEELESRAAELAGMRVGERVRLGVRLRLEMLMPYIGTRALVQAPLPCGEAWKASPLVMQEAGWGAPQLLGMCEGFLGHSHMQPCASNASPGGW